MSAVSSEKKSLVQNALEVGLAAYSESLAWVAKGCYISSIDNIAFVYALFRSKKAEHVLLAAERLSALLYFANEEGRMPDHLHEYPKAKGIKASLYMATVCTLILKGFHKVLPPALKARIEAHISQFIVSIESKKAVMNPFAQALFHVVAGQKVGIPKEEPLNEEHWLYLMLLAKLQGEQEKVCEKLSAYYLPPFQIPTNSLYPFFLEGVEPFKDLFHYVVNYHSLAKTALTQDTSSQLRAGLFEAVPTQGIQEITSYTHVLTQEQEHYSAKTGHPVWHYLFLDGKELYSLVMEEGAKPTLDIEKQRLSWEFTEESFEDKEKREVMLHINNREGLNLLVNGEKSTLFRLGDRVSLHTKGKVLELVFNLEQGQGDFVGQLAFGNRVSQKKPFEVGSTPTDQIISLRTLRRTGDVVLSMTYKLEDKAS
tara:strand:+ start:1263 stop:2540 length:1278 start_codon:yes stop_codon:yes gene_type:complete